MPSIPNAFDRESRFLNPFEEVGPQSPPSANDRICLHTACAKLGDTFVSEKPIKIKDYSVSQEWHRAYVEAFFETDGCKLAVVIAEAERAIVGRFLELSISSAKTDEFIDLQSAAYALTQLKRANEFADTPQHLVA